MWRGSGERQVCPVGLNLKTFVFGDLPGGCRTPQAMFAGCGAPHAM